MGKRGRPRKKEKSQKKKKGKQSQASMASATNKCPTTLLHLLLRGLPSLPVHYSHARSRYPTRCGKMILAQGATMGNITSKPPSQTQGLKYSSFLLKVPYSTCEDGKRLPEILALMDANDLADIEKFTSKLLHQSQGPEKHHPADPPSAPYELVLDNHLPNMEATEAPNIIENRHEERANNLDQKAEPTQSLSLNITEMAAMNDDFSDLDEVASALNVALVTVNGYRVKEEFASQLRDIFSKYGDIAKDSSLQSERSRSFFLEMVCGIFQRLQGTKFTDVTHIKLKSMLDIIGDIEFVKLEVGWLRTRLQEIYEAKLLFMGCSSLKEAKTRNSEAIGKMEQLVEGYQIEMQILQEKISLSEDKLAAMKAESEKINGMVLNTKT
ncbi:unnamed protein product [Camellia sinensis]